MAALQCFVQGLFIHHAAARAVHDYDALLHLGDAILVDYVESLVGLGHVERDVVGALQQVRELDQLADRALLDERVIDQHAHAHRDGALAEFGADAARTDEAEGLAEEFGTLEGLLLPLAVA